MLLSRPIFNIIIVLLLFSLICVTGLADSVSRSCMVLVTTTSGGSVQPEGAVTIPYGSGLTLTFTPSSGYIIHTILVDGTDAGQYSSISLSSIVHDMTVHGIFIPKDLNRSESDSPIADSSPSSSGSAILPSENTNNDLDNRYFLELYPGWNFISTPSVLVSGTDTARIFEMIDTAGHSMYSFNNSTWIPMKGEDQIVPLHGYWIYSKTGVAVPLSFDPGTIPTPVHLLQGWNAIGYPGIQQALAYEALSSLDASWSYAIGFNADMQAYEGSIMQEIKGDEIMYPSRGYWLYMKQDWFLQPITG